MTHNQPKAEEQLDIEVYEVESSTVLDDMGASKGHNSCSSVIQTR